MADPDVMDALRDLNETIGALRQGLALMVETQKAQGRLLVEIHQSLAAKPGPSPVADALRHIAAELEKQGETLDAILLRLAGPAPEAPNGSSGNH